MKANPLLSIVIPTYNRSEFLDYSLEVHIPLARAHNIQIFISDNASTDATAEIVNKRIKEYPFIKYCRNEINVGPDENFELALNYPQTEYVWLLGDTYKLPAGGIDYVLDLVTANKEKYEVIVLNFVNRVIGIPTQDYSDQNKLLSDLGWHMTCMASSVYSYKLITKADFGRYRNTYFIQTGVIFEYLANKEFLVHWVDSLSLQETRLEGVKKESWQDQTIDVWVNKWGNFIFSLPPSYVLGIKLKCIMDHGINSGIFTLNQLMILRSINIINYKIYKRYVHLFPFSIKYSNLTILVIALLPRRIFLILKTIKDAIKGC